MIVVPVLGGLIKSVDCYVGEIGTFSMDANPNVECFVGGHAWAAAIAVPLLMFYGITVILTAPFIMADSEGKFTSEDLDLRYEPIFYLTERLCRCTMAGVALFFCHYPSVVRNVNLVCSVGLAYQATSTLPCSVIAVNTLRSALYQATALVSLCVLLDAILPTQSLPVLVLLVGVPMLILNFARHVWSAKAMPDLQFGGVVGSEILTDDSVPCPWSDVSILRGFHHRLAMVFAWEDQQDGLKGLQFVYHVDGVVQEGPFHGNLDNERPTGPPTTTIELEEDDFFIAMHYLDGPIFRNPRFALATSKGHKFFLGPRRLGIPGSGMPKDVSDWSVKAELGTVVGFHGYKNERILCLGFIVQSDLSMEATDGRTSSTIVPSG